MTSEGDKNDTIKRRRAPPSKENEHKSLLAVGVGRNQWGGWACGWYYPTEFGSCKRTGWGESVKQSTLQVPNTKNWPSFSISPVRTSGKVGIFFFFSLSLGTAVYLSIKRCIYINTKRGTSKPKSQIPDTPSRWIWLRELRSFQVRCRWGVGENKHARLRNNPKMNQDGKSDLTGCRGRTELNLPEERTKRDLRGSNGRCE